MYISDLNRSNKNSVTTYSNQKKSFSSISKQKKKRNYSKVANNTGSIGIGSLLGGVLGAKTAYSTTMNTPTKRKFFIFKNKKAEQLKKDQAIRNAITGGFLGAGYGAGAGGFLGNLTRQNNQNRF